MELFEGMSVKLTQVGGFTRSIGLIVGFGFLSIIALLVAGSPKQQTGLALIFAILVILLPGLLLMRSLNIFPSDYLAQIIYGSAAIISIVTLIHPLLSRVNLGFLTLSIILIIGLISFYISYKKDLLLQPKLININQFYFFLPLLSIASIWIGLQAAAVPASNLDKFVVPPDIYHHMSIAAEITNHGGEIFPYVAGSGIDLIYHYGAFTLGSFLTFNGFFTLPIAMFRIEFILLSFLYIFGLFIVGKDLTQKNLGGFIAIVVGSFTQFPSLFLPDGFSFVTIQTGSMSQLAGSALLVVGVGLTLKYFTCQQNKNYLLFLIFLIAAAATFSKGPTGAMLLGFVAVVTISERLLNKNWSTLKFFGSSVLGFLIVIPFVYELNSSGQNGVSLEINLLGTLKTIFESQGTELNQRNLFIYLLVFCFSLLTPAFAGAFYLRPSKNLSIKIGLIASIFAGTLGFLIFEAWGGSQRFLYYPAIPIAALLIALIFMEFFEDKEIRRPLLFIILGLVGQNIVYTILLKWINPDALTRDLLWLFSVIIIFSLALLLAKYLIALKNLKAINAALISVLSVGVLSGLLVNDAKPMPVGNNEHPWSLTVGTEAAAQYIKSNSDKDDVIAVNRSCVGPNEDNPCHARMFATSALSERRVLLEGWSYTTCPLSEPLINSFWDNSIFELNKDLMIKPSVEVATLASKYGVKWLLIDKQRPHSSNYEEIAELEFEFKQVQVWKLKENLISQELITPKGCK